jgi:hypothetical protein
LVGFLIISSECAPRLFGLRKGPYRCIPRTPGYFFLNSLTLLIAYRISCSGEEIKVGNINGVPNDRQVSYISIKAV